MPICSYKDCTYGANGRRFSGSIEDVHEHEVTIHGKKVTPCLRGPGISIGPSNKNVVNDYIGELSYELHRKQYSTHKGGRITNSSITKFKDLQRKK